MGKAKTQIMQTDSKSASNSAIEKPQAMLERQDGPMRAQHSSSHLFSSNSSVMRTAAMMSEAAEIPPERKLAKIASAIQRQVGNVRMTSLLGCVHAKVTVGSAGDPYEKEADELASRIASGQQGGRISRFTPCGFAKPIHTAREEQQYPDCTKERFGTGDTNEFQRLATQYEPKTQIQRQEHEKQGGSKTKAKASGKQSDETTATPIPVNILPPATTADAKLDHDAETEIKLESWVSYKASGGKIISFELMQEARFQTIYGPGASPSGPAGYGRGTTEQDIKDGNTSLEFHEDCHIKDAIQYLKNNPLPQFAGTKGMPKEEFFRLHDEHLQALKKYKDELLEHGRKVGDCVGKKKKGCPE